jgi:hypothetical protein
MAPQVGYSILSISAIKAIGAEDRVNGYCRITRGNFNSWYMFVESSTAIPDEINVLLPNDNPTTGRWHKSNENPSLPAILVCENQCNLDGSGKALKFYAPYEGEIIVKPSFDIAIGDYWEQELRSGNETRDKSVEVQVWNQEPNFNMDGRKFVENLPRTGGKVSIKMDSDYRWLSIFACEDGGSSRDGVCFIINQNLITLIDFN